MRISAIFAQGGGGHGDDGDHGCDDYFRYGGDYYYHGDHDRHYYYEYDRGDGGPLGGIVGTVSDFRLKCDIVAVDWSR